MNGSDLLFFAGLALLAVTIALMFYITRLHKELDKVETEVNDYRIIMEALKRAAERKLDK